MTLTKRDIARTVHEADPAISIVEGAQIVDSILRLIKQRLENGEKVMISNFGNFQVLKRAAREGVNPATGERMLISSYRAVCFKPASALNRDING